MEESLLRESETVFNSVSETGVGNLEKNASMDGTYSKVGTKRGLQTEGGGNSFFIK